MADAYTPSDGLKNVTSFPTDPADETAARKQVQDVLDQMLAFHNTHLAETVSGTWTPVIAGYDVAGVNTYTTQFGEYTKSDKKVTVKFAVALSAKDASMEGAIIISGLPLATKTNFVYFNHIIGVATTTLLNNLYCNVSGTTLVVNYSPTGSATSNVYPANLTDTSLFCGEITYYIA
jgi:hypothetical protein